MKTYRKIWQEAYGEIPVDNEGRTYEIHHIDGNNKNNNLDNLICVSIQEHYEIHRKQGDAGAAMSVLRRMKKTPEETARLNSEIMKEWNSKPEVKEKLRKLMIDRWKNNIDYATKTRKILAETSRERVKNGTHNFLDPEIQKENVKRLTKICRERVKNGTHNFQTKESSERSSRIARERNSIEHTCPHCNKKGRGPIMKRHHFNNCKHLLVESNSGKEI